MIIDSSGNLFDDRRKGSAKLKKIVNEEGEVFKDRRKSKDQIKKKK